MLEFSAASSRPKTICTVRTGGSIAALWQRPGPMSWWATTALVIAKGSCAEVRSQLYVALDCGYITQQDFDGIVALAQEVAKIVGGLRASVQRQRDAVAKD